MPIYGDDVFENQTELLRNIYSRFDPEAGNDVDYFNQLITPNNTSVFEENDAVNPNWGLNGSGQDLLPDMPTEPPEELNFDVFGDMNTEDEITSAEDARLSVLRNSPGLRAIEKRHNIYQYSQLSSADFALKNMWNRWEHKDDPEVSTDTANAYLKSLGIKATVTEPTSLWELDNIARTYDKKKRLEASLYEIETTGGVRGWRGLTVLGSSLAGAVGPVEAVTTVAAGFIVPELAISGVATGAKAIKTSLTAGKSYKSIREALAMQKALQTRNTIAKGMSGVGNAVERDAAINFAAKGSSYAKTAELEKDTLNLLSKLEDLEKLKYGNLTAREKTALDVLTYGTVDAPFIYTTLRNSDEMGLDLYTAKDAMFDLGFAGFMGVVVPKGLRKVGDLAGFSPIDLQVRRAENLLRNTDVQEALGEITKPEADQIRKIGNKILSNAEELKGQYKAPNPKYVESMETLKRTNISDEDLKAQQITVINNLMAGIRPKVHALPNYKSIMSNIDATVLEQFKRRNVSAKAVFGEYLQSVTTKRGLSRMQVKGETGLLGRAPVTGLNEAESEYWLREMYRGFVLLNDSGNIARSNFIRWAKSFDTFVAELEDIHRRATSQFEYNRKVTHGELPPENKIIPAKNLVNIKKEFEDAYLKYKLSTKEYNQYLKTKTDNDLEAALGFSAQPYPDFVQAVLRDFDAFYNEHIIESKNKKGITQYDFRGISKLKDPSTRAPYFKEYLNELRQAADDNMLLAQSDNYFRQMSSENVDEILRAVTEYDISSDTTLDKLFGTQRRSIKELEDLDADNKFWEDLSLTADIRHQSFKDNINMSNSIKVLNKFSSVDGATPSHFQKQSRLLDIISDMKKENFESLKSSLVNNIREHKTLSLKVKQMLDTGSTDKGLEYSLREVLSKTMSDTDLAKNIGGSNINRIVNQLVQRVNRLAKDDPEIIRVLLSDPKEALAESGRETMQRLVRQATEGSEVKRQEIQAEQFVKAKMKLDTLFRPLFEEFNIELNRLSLQAYHDIELMADTLELMKLNPSQAAEVLTGSATQTIYNYAGSKRNVEYMTKTYGYYMNDLKNRLSKMSSQTISGKSLLDVFNDSKNTKDILSALVTIKHNSDLGKANSDIVRIAEEINKQEASFAGGFLKYGSNYKPHRQYIKRSKLTYMDVAVPDKEADEVYSLLDSNASVLSTDTLRQLIPTDAEGKIVYGNNKVVRDDKLNDKIISWAKEVGNISKRIREIDNPIYRKMAVWALRDFDLDSMFDPNATAYIGLNKVRDAIFTGDWESIIQGDAGNLRHLAIDAKRLSTILLGKDFKRMNGSVYPGSDSWVYTYRSGLKDIGSVYKGEKVAAFDAMESGIRFKDTESEIRATELFGYDNIKEYMEASLNSMFQAYYTIERFGSKPMEFIDDCVNTYERARKSKGTFSDDLREIYLKTRGTDEGIGEKFAISENARISIKENAMLNCGLQNHAPSTATRLVKSIIRLIASPMLMAAGWKSLGDYATIWEGLLMNAYAEGRTQAAALTGRATRFLMQNKDVRDLFLATSILEGEDLLRKMSNDPAANIVNISAGASKVDVFENWSNKVANFMLNGVGRMESITNSNKMVAGLCIQAAIGSNAGTSYKSLNPKLQTALLRESITEADWDFMRKNLVHNVKDYVNSELPNKTLKMNEDSFDLFIPLSISKVSDNTIKAELEARGLKNVTPLQIDDFRRDMISKAWNIVNSSADEMVSIPSNRVGNIMRFGRARGSGWGTFAEIITQFQSFGASLVYNTYGRRLAGALDGEVGVSILDLFNPAVRLSRHSRSEIFLGLTGSVFSIATTFVLIDNVIRALQGNIQKPYDENGVHLDNLMGSALGSLGLLGTVLDAVYTGIEGSGQRGGGLSVQVAPAISNLTRQGYNLRQPLVSSRISDSDRASAFSASLAKNIIGATGLPKVLVIGPAYQYLFGAWLDQHARGGYSNYRAYQKARERRGQVLMPWEEDPRPVWERLQYE